jgi:hypothetical protein
MAEIAIPWELKHCHHILHWIPYWIPLELSLLTVTKSVPYHYIFFSEHFASSQSFFKFDRQWRKWVSTSPQMIANSMFHTKLDWSVVRPWSHHLSRAETQKPSHSATECPCPSPDIAEIQQWRCNPDKNNMVCPRHDEPLKRNPSGPSALYWIVNCLGCLYLPMSGCSNHL